MSNAMAQPVAAKRSYRPGGAPRASTGATPAATSSSVNIEDNVATVNRGARPGGSSASRNRAYRSNQSYEGSLKSMYRRQRQDYDAYTQPVVDMLEDEASSNDTYARSNEMAGKIPEQVQEISDRKQEYHASGMLPSQSNAMSNRQGRNVAKAQNSVVTQGYQNQVAKHRAARTNLMSISDNLQSTGVAGIAQVTAQKNQRDAMYEKQKSGFASQLGAIAGAGIGFMAGGPAGMAAGASIGGAVGGAAG
jgi:hypothetical protein